MPVPTVSIYKAYWSILYRSTTNISNPIEVLLIFIDTHLMEVCSVQVLATSSVVPLGEPSNSHLPALNSVSLSMNHRLASVTSFASFPLASFTRVHFPPSITQYGKVWAKGKENYACVIVIKLTMGYQSN